MERDEFEKAKNKKKVFEVEGEMVETFPKSMAKLGHQYKKIYDNQDDGIAIFAFTSASGQKRIAVQHEYYIAPDGAETKIEIYDVDDQEKEAKEYLEQEKYRSDNYISE